MWFASMYGLNRYDGYKFKVFKHEPGNPNSLSGVHNYSLFKDHSGMLWVGCSVTLNIATPRTTLQTPGRPGRFASFAPQVPSNQSNIGRKMLKFCCGLTWCDK